MVDSDKVDQGDVRCVRGRHRMAGQRRTTPYDAPEDITATLAELQTELRRRTDPHADDRCVVDPMSRVKDGKLPRLAPIPAGSNLFDPSGENLTRRVVGQLSVVFPRRASGGARRSSTRCTCAASPTGTVTGRGHAGLRSRLGYA